MERNNLTTANIAKATKSGESSPENAKSTSTRPRSSSLETVFTSVTSTTLESTMSLVYPAPPLNSPLAQSEIGDRHVQHEMSMSNLSLKLKNVPGRITPPGSEPDHEGMSAPDVYVRDFGAVMASKVKKNTVLTSGVSRAAGNVATSTAEADNNTAQFPEHSIWAHFADEDVSLSLKRLAMVARDLHKSDDSKSVKQYYSERLATLIAQSEVEFDCSELH
ncbi:hypothetical protein LTR08_001249 [Meristemomyces frigidus]|nr:hypothetical protein LTR08_001249 [Meristemomyces frigidus]